MRAKGRFLLVLVCLLLAPVSLGAADYKQWLPLLPESLGGLARSGKPDGMNMEMGQQSWSSLQQEYSNKSKQVSMTIVSGIVAPQAQAFQMMSQMQMETEDQIVKTLEVAGYKAVFQLEKESKTGILTIALNQQTLVAIEAKPTADEAELVGLAKEIPLNKIAAQAK